MTVLVSPLAFESTSLSLLRTLPTGWKPIPLLLTPPASTAVLLSLLDIGASFSAGCGYGERCEACQTTGVND